MKLAVIGAGSTYTPELVSGLVRERERLDINELFLHDIDHDRREIVGGLARRILERQAYPGSLQLTGELDRALEGADAVLIQIRVGGQAARLQDETIPAACGCVGQETTGAGGLAKAWRTVPVVLEIAERARELAAPDAWIVDFTNPVGIVTRALLDAGHRAVGLCNVAINFQRWLAAHLGVEPGQVLVEQVGLNHLTWIRAVSVDGQDVLSEVLSTHGAALAHEVGMPLALMERLQAIPSYYLRYFYAEREVLQEQRMCPPRAQVVAGIERQLLELYRDPHLTEKPALLDQRGGAYYSEAAVQLLASLRSGGGDVQIVDVRNGHTLAGLAPDDVVEVPARIGSEGPVPLAQKPLAPELLGLVQHVANYERLAASAAARADRDAAWLALLAHPLVREWRLADGLLERMPDLSERAPVTSRRPPAKARRSTGSELVIAVDGGNAKTDLALVDATGELLSLARGGRSSPHYIGVDGCARLLGMLFAEALSRASLPDDTQAATAQIMLAGVDLPEELDPLRAKLQELGWASRLVVDNDTFALLRTGTDRGWGVAIVCGSGINCVGVAPDGRQVRFPSLGDITGDWGGGTDVGMAALAAAVKGADGRGQQTVLEQTVPAYFGFSEPLDVARALHLRQMRSERLGELAPVVFSAAQERDPVASEIVSRVGDEIVTFAAATLRRLQLTDQAPDVVLGGGLVRAAPSDMLRQIRQAVKRIAPNATLIVSETGPIVGAALLGLDELAADAAAAARVRAELEDAFARVERAGAQGLDGRILAVGPPATGPAAAPSTP